MSKLLFIILGFSYLTAIYRKVKNKLFSEKESLFWMVSGIITLILSVAPNIINKIAKIFGVVYPPSLLFLLSILFLTYIAFRQSQQISLLNERVKELAERNALIEQKIDNQTEVQH